jgi:hypothetical protein
MNNNTQIDTVENAIETELSFIHSSVRTADFDLGFKTGAVAFCIWQKKQDEVRYKELLDSHNELLKEFILIEASIAGALDGLVLELDKYKHLIK